MENKRIYGKDVVMGAWAPYYDLFMKTYTLGRDRKLREMEMDMIGVSEGDRVLEIGCGTGTLTLAAKGRAGLSGMVCGIDAAPEMIGAARAKAARTGREVDFRVSNITGIPYDDGTFDVVMCSFMIFHMTREKREEGFREISRVLKNGGKLVIVDLLNEKRIGILRDSMSPLFSGIESGYRKIGVLLPRLAYVKGNVNH